MMQLAIGALLAAVIALAAYRGRALSTDGAVAAFAVGAIVFGARRVAKRRRAPGVLHSVVAAHARSAARESRNCAAQQRPAPRNAWQVLANGGVAALCALAALGWRIPFAAAFAGAFAAASADTWGTEIGTLSRRPPVSILTFRPHETGLSGGITLLGTAATHRRCALRGERLAALVQLAPLLPVLLRRRCGRAARLDRRREPCRRGAGARPAMRMRDAVASLRFGYDDAGRRALDPK